VALTTCTHNVHTHTGNTRQPEPQLKISLCSSAIPGHNSKDVISSHNSRNTTCLTPILSNNSRDTFWATTQGIPASRPSRYHQSIVDHVHQSRQTTLLHGIAWCNTLGAKRISFQTAWRGTCPPLSPSVLSSTTRHHTSTTSCTGFSALQPFSNPLPGNHTLPEYKFSYWSLHYHCSHSHVVPQSHYTNDWFT